MKPGSSDPSATEWGVEPGYRDVDGVWHDASTDGIVCILEAMGARSERPFEGSTPPVLVVHHGDAPAVVGSFAITAETGELFEGEATLPAQLPLGYHKLKTDSGDRTLIVAPPACLGVEGVNAWGWATQLYAMRSRSSWGMGDIGDLQTFGRLARSQGADFLLLNPLHASIPGLPQENSPYFPSSREFRNPLYIRVGDVPGAQDSPQFSDLVRHGAVLNDERLINRDAVWKLKEQALEEIFRTTTPPSAFNAFVERGGTDLNRYATFCAITEVHGRSWPHWPEDLRHPHSEAVNRFATNNNQRVLFHSWLQWLLDVQLAKAGHEIDLVQDLAIGVDPSGADAWLWQDALALEMTVGAPPDEFNTQGQNWSLPPFDPWRLQALAYAPFIRTVRACLQNAGGLRIDHVMGLFRLYWIPKGWKASQGTYVRYPWRDLFAILTLESHRANARVVGEDLGTIEPFMRDELEKRNVMSCRLVWFEKDAPTKFPTKALATVTTHDLATIAGLWTGSDLDTQHHLNTQPNVASTNEIRDRLQRNLGVPDKAPVHEVIKGTHELLAGAPSAWVAATLDDALGVEERPNMPGTTNEWPNWRLSLPVPLDDFADNDLFVATAAALRAGRAAAKGSS